MVLKCELVVQCYALYELSSKPYLCQINRLSLSLSLCQPVAPCLPPCQPVAPCFPRVSQPRPSPHRVSQSHPASHRVSRALPPTCQPVAPCLPPCHVLPPTVSAAPCLPPCQAAAPNPASANERKREASDVRRISGAAPVIGTEAALRRMSPGAASPPGRARQIAGHTAAPAARGAWEVTRPVRERRLTARGRLAFPESAPLLGTASRPSKMDLGYCARGAVPRRRRCPIMANENVACEGDACMLRCEG